MENGLAKYGHSFQLKVITCLLSDVSFTQQISDILKVNYFDSEANRWLVEVVFDYFFEYKKIPTLDVFKAKLIEVNQDVLKESIKTNLKQVWLHLESSELQFVKDKTLDFCRHQELSNAIIESAELVESEQNYDKIKTLIDDAMKAGMDKSIGHEYNKDVKSRYEESVRDCIPTPWPSLNDLMDGGLAGGELGVIVAPGGVGKSWGLINLGCEAAKLGANVVHYTLELYEEYVGLRYDAVGTGIPIPNLKYHVEDVEAYVQGVPGLITIREYPTKTASTNTLKAHIDKIKMLGQEIALIVVDYADLLKPAGRRMDSKHEELGMIYEELRGMAGEYDIPIWTASQTNRSGVNEQVIEADKIAASYEKIMIADFVVSLSRDIDDKLSGTARWHVIKNRFGPDGLTLPSEMNTSNGKIKMFDPKTPMGEETQGKMDKKQTNAKKYYAEKYKELKS